MAQAVNNFTITGNLASKPEIKETSSGKKYAFTTIAVNGRTADKADFISFVAWDKMAENIVKYCDKGDCISVLGFISTYRKDEKSVLQLTADAVTFLHKAKKAEPKPEKKIEPEADVFEAVNNSPDVFAPF